ncbi:MFS transporter [Lederbergia wuyishanensis]|uniref:MFS family permease n=1 Tax=Lederbergia wuyishanensis TaxID=1347903 RepID=A0ABU0D9M4_9BACI|nr:MFS transporter [Lederbergia wuyishanensis]MCJ8009365.1 MFS transporter [Lederbergia wuyishanensis]MDQ0345026.1 MFS family permease [Lederbergia wuyishanensis]
MFKRITGNARACLVVEPLFIIPYSLYIPYVSVYMIALGVGKTQVGLIASLGLVVQIFTSFISGFLTDRLGRKKALLIYDLISWPLAVLIWTVSQNIWFFIFAAILNGFHKIPQTAWTCLLVEDTKPKDRSIVFTILQVIGVVGGLFAPIGGLLVSKLTLIPAVRIMYAIAGTSMLIMIISRHFMTHETEIGLLKQKESNSISFKDTFIEYGKIMKNIVKNKGLLLIFAVYIFFNFQMVMQNTYLYVYLVEALSVSESTISIFPAISSVCMLFLLFFVIPRFKEELNYYYMMIGFSLSIVANAILVITKGSSLLPIIISLILSAAGVLIANPYLESAVANSIEDANRANMYSILQVFLLLFISPAGIIAGLAYKMDPRFPFIIMVSSLLINIGILLYLAKPFSRKNKLLKA